MRRHPLTLRIRDTGRGASVTGMRRVLHDGRAVPVHPGIAHVHDVRRGCRTARRGHAGHLARRQLLAVLHVYGRETVRVALVMRMVRVQGA